MTVLTPLLYQGLAGREGYPTIRRELTVRLDERFAPWSDGRPTSSFGWMVDEFSLASFLRPVDLATAATNPVIGVPVLASSTLREFLADLTITNGEPRPGTMWCEFWRTEEDSYAAFPADLEPDLRTPVLRLVPTDEAVQLHLFDMGVTVTEDGELHREPAADAPMGPCILEARRDEPGAPFRGSCKNDHCAQGCDPLILLSPDDGVYWLAGCDC